MRRNARFLELLRRAGERSKKRAGYRPSRHAALPAGPLRDAYGISLCQALARLGRRDQAWRLAEQIATPDAIVFMENLREHADAPGGGIE